MRYGPTTLLKTTFESTTQTRYDPSTNQPLSRERNLNTKLVRNITTKLLLKRERSILELENDT